MSLSDYVYMHISTRRMGSSISIAISSIPIMTYAWQKFSKRQHTTEVNVENCYTADV